MRRLAMIGLCIAAMVAVGGVSAATAAAEAPEFGRCIKKAKAEGSGYSSANCTSFLGSGAKFEWQPGPGPNPRFTSAARFVPTPTYKHCLAWQREKEAGNEKGAMETLERYGLTAEGCEKTLKEEEGKEPAVLETVSGLRIECGGASSVGEYTGVKSVGNVVTTFTECEFNEIFTCQSPGAKAGEIVSASLQGVLGVIKTEGLPANNKIGLDLQATIGETISEIECGSFFKVTVTGSVIHQISVNKMVLEENEKFIQKKGSQKPEKFEGLPADVLESTSAGGSPVQAGLGLLTRLTNDEKIEVSSIL
ncbi:MAG TPA: hypothetical protein VGQ42_08625 [Candidatus Dormibacteraeota bacterium]|nr:hypothetical protein [Candidatus Dormibacteraeota bacterium]